MVVHFLQWYIAMVTYDAHLCCCRAACVQDNRSRRLNAPPTDPSILCKTDLPFILAASNVKDKICENSALKCLKCLLLYILLSCAPTLSPDVLNNVHTQRNPQFTQGSGVFHLVVCHYIFPRDWERLMNETKRNMNKTWNTTSPINICAWLTSHRLSSAMLVVLMVWLQPAKWAWLCLSVNLRNITECKHPPMEVASADHYCSQVI